ncbi:F-box/kelch-repeat protein at3g23880 [Phtheirospermum japonicum]|uniref:F-box/kelch-repeat protein at3g23880 n=1 Tax=Phtheirospermum japonicum TaxID=374723 RepID=A0A830BU58_9LAMI|nr:F-box/kelch-repeat protein at3g23880 [Phtheirospermum japonicum]
MQLLPEDVIEDILSRLPVKSLLRFRCVCKHWKTLISSSRRFAFLHLKRSLSNPTMHSIIIRQSSYDFNDRLPSVYLDPVNLAPLPAAISSHLDPYHPVVNPIDPHKPARIFVGSINGLVCLRSTPEFEPDWIGIWNPSTKTVRELIPTTKADFYTVAFGWDPSANDHKVLRLCRSASGGSGGWVEVWSVGSSRSWRSFPIDPMYDVLPICTQNLIMDDGNTYCLVSRGKESIHGDIIRYRDLIACFDMVKEELQFISLPIDTNDSDGDAVALMNWKGTLALSTLIEKPGVNNPPSFQAWRMDKDSEAWTKSFIIDLSDGRFVYNPATSITPTQVLILDMGQIYLYDLETKDSQKIRVRNDARLQACYHVESLF